MKQVTGFCIFLALFTLAAFAGPAQTQEVREILLKNATVINPKDETARKADVLIVDDKIQAVAESIQPTPSQKVVDLTGKFIIPGLIDAHVHPIGNAGANQQFEYLGLQGTATRALQSGVIAILDVFSDEAENIPFRNNQNKLIGADFYTSGTCFTATKGHCTEYQVQTRTIDTPEQARKSVRDLIETKKPDVIKIVYDDAFAAHPGGMPTIDQPTMAAAVKTAGALGVKTVIHIGTWDNARKALKAGASAITHTHCEPIPSDVIKLMQEKKAYFIPTLVVQTELLSKVNNPKLWTDALAKRVVPEAILAEYLKPDKFNDFNKGFVRYQKNCSGHLFDNIRKASEAGVKIMTGSDIPNPGTFVGYSVHREMDLFQQAGINNWEILRSATTYGAEFLETSYGIDPGDIASLVVLNSSPLESIRNTKNIGQVMHRGRFVELKQVK